MSKTLAAIDSPIFPTDAGRSRIAPIRVSIELRSLSSAANSASCASASSNEGPRWRDSIAGQSRARGCREAPVAGARGLSAGAFVEPRRRLA